VTERELAFFLIGFCSGVIVSMLSYMTQRALLHRAQQIQQREALVQERAQQLREKLADSTGRSNWQLDVEAIYTSLFSEDGFDPGDGKGNQPREGWRVADDAEP
jgi:TorA maturation chaperone TorD